VFTYRPELPFLIVSLLAHHLSDEILVRFLRWFEATARNGWLVCDI
jgi:hypothetical protein